MSATSLTNSTSVIHKIRGIILWSRRSRDADKIVGLFSREMGRLTARATSAARSQAKFVSLTEPFVESELAFYIQPGQGWGKLVGGRLIQSFPGLRTQLSRSTAASWVCEVIYRLTAEEQASPEKYDLLLETLNALQTVEQFPVLRLGFALRFLSLAGFGLDNQPAYRSFRNEHPEWAQSLLEAPLENLGQSVWSSPAMTALEQVAGGIVADYLNRPLLVNRFRQMTGIQI